MPSRIRYCCWKVPGMVYVSPSFIYIHFLCFYLFYFVLVYFSFAWVFFFLDILLWGNYLTSFSSSDVAEWYFDEFNVEYQQIQRELQVTLPLILSASHISIHFPLPVCSHLILFIQVGGIFVRVFNRSPSLPSNPSDFLSSLLTTILDPSSSDNLSVLIEAIYNIFSLQPPLIGQLGTDEQAKLQSVVSLIFDTLNSRSSWDDHRFLKHLVMTLRLLANSKSSPLLSFTAEKAITPLIKVFILFFFKSVFIVSLHIFTSSLPTFYSHFFSSSLVDSESILPRLVPYTVS